MKRTIALLAIGALGLVACGDDDASGVSTSGAWARTSPMSSEIGAMYVVLEAGTDDELTAVNVSTDVAGRTELHETVMVPPSDASMPDASMPESSLPDASMPESSMPDSSMPESTMTGDDESSDEMAGDDMGGVMTMQHVTSIPLPAGTEVALEPGGLHVMLLDLAAPLEAGTTFEATLVFAESDPVDVTVEVRDTAS